jgi:hypothetical protein
MKHLTPVKNKSNEAIKCSVLMNNWNDEAVNASSLRFVASLLHRKQH